jgi:heme/copper-type cytochrome/quinol oxidase subunit 2
MNSKYAFMVETKSECAIVLFLSIFAILLSIPAAMGTFVSVSSMATPVGWETMWFSFLAVVFASLTVFLVVVPIYFMRVCAWYIRNMEKSNG